MTMAGRLLVRCLRTGQRQQVAGLAGFKDKCGNREVVGFGMNSEASYLDHEAWPMPAIRYKEITPDIAVLKEKEKGDWKKLTIEEKKQLYRASFRQTFAEMRAPTGEWKSIIGSTLMMVTLSIWMFILCSKYVCEPLPETLDEEHQLAQLERMRLLDVDPITGLNRRK